MYFTFPEIPSPWKVKIIENLWAFKSLAERNLEIKRASIYEGLDTLCTGEFIDMLFKNVTRTNLKLGIVPRGYYKVRSKKGEEDERVALVDEYLERPRIQLKIPLPEMTAISDQISSKERQEVIRDIAELCPEKPEDINEVEEFYFFMDDMVENVYWYKVYIAGRGLIEEGIAIDFVDLNPNFAEAYHDNPPPEIDYYKALINFYDKVTELIRKYNATQNGIKRHIA